MYTVAEVEQYALGLPEDQRAILVRNLLSSLRPVLHDEDEGIEEALRRDAELDANPALGMSLEEFDEQIKRHRS